MTLKLVPPISAPDPHLRIVRDDEAEAAVSVAYLCDRRVRAIVDSNPNRMVRLTRDGAVTREVTVGYVLAALIARKKLADELLDPVAAEEKRARAEAMARRAAGLPDLCATCGNELGVGKSGMCRRARMHPKEWACQRCSIRAYASALPPERRAQLVAAAQGALAAMGPERREQMMKTVRSATSPEQRRARMLAMSAAMSPEERRDRARKANAAVSPERRAEAARKAMVKFNATLTKEERSARRQRGAPR